MFTDNEDQARKRVAVLGSDVIANLNMPSADAVIGVSSVLLGFFFSAGIGLIFGVWPARRAATLDPITALRYE